MNINPIVPASNYVTLVEVLERTAPYDEFLTVVQSAVSRLEHEGVRALVSFQFYATPDSNEAGVLITFSDRDQMINHIKLITGWEEFTQFLRVVKPIDVRVYGKLSPEAEAWIQQFDVLSKTYAHHVAGFVRPTSPDENRE